MSGQLKNDTEERKLRVTLLSAGWKASSNGDLTTINRELAIQMAKHPYVEVSVFLPWCSEEDKKDADGYNVKLIEAVKGPGLKPVFWLASVPDGHAMDCVLGHGVDLGQQIPLIKGNPNYSHCKWIQVVHTAPEEIGMYKSISEGQQMQQTEIELCKMADQVVTIGPKLTDAYKHQLRKQDIFNLTPSILSEFSDVQQASDEERTFCVLVTESGDCEDFYVKGYDVAAKAIAELKDKSYQLKFASKQRGKEDELANKLLQCGIGRNQLMICSFDENRETLANLFSAVDIAILPSKTEGFGLSALEAISAGLPVLVNGNSGIAEALRKVPNGSQCIVDSEDPAEWARAIKAVRYKERNVRLAEARFLRENYLQQFSWEKPCNSLVEKMYSLAFGGEIKITVGVDDLKPEEQNMQTGMLTTESVRQQEVQQPRASATSAAPGSVSHPQTEDLLALKEKNFQSILEGCYHSTKPQSIEEWNWFREYAKEMRLIITGVSVGSLVITVKCESLMILEELWKDYSSGHLGEVVQNCFVTERILKELNLAELRLKTTMDIEEYNACKMFFEKDTLRGALSSEFHSTSSTSESSQKKQQWEKSEQKTKIMETVKLEGASSSEFHSISSTSESPQNQEELKKWKQETKIVETEKQKSTSPLTVEPTTGHGKELIEKEQGRKGILPPHGSSTSDPQEKLEELRMNLKKQVTCSICLDTFTEPKIISCHHTFCCECLERHASVSQRQGKFRCPECQVEISLPEGNRFDCLPNSFLHKSLLSVLQAESCEGTSPSHVPFTAGHKKKWEVRHNTGKFQEKKGSSSPPPLSATDLEEKLGKVCEDIKMLRMEGSSPPPVSTVEVELEELVKKLQKGRLEGSSPPPLLSTTDLEEKIGKVCEDIKMLRVEGSSPPPVSTVEGEPKELFEKLQEVRMEALENAMYPTIRSGLAKFDVSVPEELQNYVSYLLNESAKLGLCRREFQSPRAMEELREAMDEDELETFLTIHIREGAWQVVLLFIDELATHKLPWDWYREVWDEDGNEDGEMFSLPLYSSSSGILKAWPIKHDHDLITLCKAITNRDWKVNRLILSDRQISNEGFKNLSTALTQSELYSLTLSHIGSQSQGSKHLCEALISGDCNLTSLNVSGNWLGDDGLMQLCNALTSVNCTLTNLNVSENWLGDEGMVHLCNALTSVDCTVTSLNVSGNWSGDKDIMHLCNALTCVNCKLTSLNVTRNLLRDEGIMHLCNALIGVNCSLTSLNVSDNWFGDEGMVHLCNALTSVNCILTSLNVSENWSGDKGIKYLCKALTDTNCKLRNLNLRGNRNVTDVGKQCLIEGTTGTDWEVREGPILCRSIKSEA